MGKAWAIVMLAGFVSVASSVRISAEELQAGLSAREWQQIVSAIKLEPGTGDDSEGFEQLESLYALDQKLGPEASVSVRFGYSVAIDGDTAVVGAYKMNTAFVLSRAGGDWEFIQRFSPTEGWGEYCREFGFSVAIDGPIIAVGATGWGTGGLLNFIEPGNVYIFEELDPGVWTFAVRLVDLWPGGWTIGPSDLVRMGTSVAVSGSTVVGGSPDWGDSAAGACFVATKSGGVWSFEQEIQAPYPSADDQFGLSVALFGDTLAVGAPNDLVSFSPEAGRVHVFDRTGSSWSHTVDLTASDSRAGNHFGTSVSLVTPVLLIGAPDDDLAAGVDAGSAFVFTLSGEVWSQRQQLVALDGEAYDRFGYDVALGFGFAFVGAPDDNNGTFSIDAGSAYVFTSFYGTWFQSSKVYAPNGEMSDHFGFSVAVWGSTAVVGCPFDDLVPFKDSGSVHFYEQNADGWGYDQTLIYIPDFFGWEFGRSVAVDGDVLAVGILSTSGVFPGRVGIFSRTGDEWGLEESCRTRMESPGTGNPSRSAERHSSSALPPTDHTWGVCWSTSESLADLDGSGRCRRSLVQTTERESSGSALMWPLTAT